MEQPVYLRRLRAQKTLLIIGAVVALVAGLLAGFTIRDGGIAFRADRTYAASATVLLTSPTPDYFQTQVPETTQALPQTTDGAVAEELIVQEASPIDLSGTAIILAYLASSDEIAEQVAENIGGFADGDAITAVRRTTQPGGDERFGGRLTLPIIDIVGVSTSGERAETIAAEATAVFADYVEDSQRKWGVPEDIRLVLDELNAPVAGTGEGSNPAIPIVVVTLGVFVLFIALALVVGAVRDRRREDGSDGDDDVAAEGPEDDDAPRPGEIPAADAPAATDVPAEANHAEVAAEKTDAARRRRAHAKAVAQIDDDGGPTRRYRRTSSTIDRVPTIDGSAPDDAPSRA
ncbi:hypothetical protein [Microbacterium caowuchunii]|uniref:Capsular polysaccharide biosynthesis protein n=1 Tax=Microbacterium caowuchunii TaxID=2614638 RepID=A0A5N0TEN8_9MICO|nr:hypothetical protein [Microbacterium caowuchunii]KAA9132914.1 hypothetical protein F6B40_10040 [Microbacterium caowuchunii]